LIAGTSLGIKLRYWLYIDAAVDRADAVHVTGLGGNSAVRSAEAPHTESNYLLREMGFVVARRHARRLRSIVMVAGFAVPAAALLFAQWLGRIEVPFAALACVAVIGALFIERWLFFAQARHAVVGYYR
jgi:DMSO reductase anchor subunit